MAKKNSLKLKRYILVESDQNGTGFATLIQRQHLSLKAQHFCVVYFTYTLFIYYKVRLHRSLTFTQQTHPAMFGLETNVFFYL